MTVLTDQANPEWEPFGAPVFDSPEMRALERVGVIDVGSNSVRMVVFDGAARSPAYFFNEKIMCALGAGVSETGHLSPSGRKRALKAMERFSVLARSMGLSSLQAIATAAVRDASDGPDFCAEVEAKTGIHVRVIDGREEARLTAQGVMVGWPGSYGLVCDIGGSSMELAEISDGEVGRRETSDLGPLKMQAVKGGRRGRRAHIKETMARLTEAMGKQRDRLFLVGGSWRAIARVDMYRRGYPLHVLHEYRMTRDAVGKTLKFIREAEDLDALRSSCGVSATRMALVPYAAEVLAQLIKTFKPKDIAISAYGIREGLLFEKMPAHVQDRDPLIEACRFAESKDARLPGFGRELYKFILPIFRSVPNTRKRIIKSACLLHDVTWRAHPDYRAQVCFDNATRANLGGLKHSERVYLGLALLHRYSNKRVGAQFEALAELLPEKDLREAEALGKAMRLGAMLWSDMPRDQGSFKWFPKRRVLELHVSDEMSALFGEVAESRFKSLAETLEAEHVVKRKR